MLRALVARPLPQVAPLLYHLESASGRGLRWFGSDPDGGQQPGGAGSSGGGGGGAEQPHRVSSSKQDGSAHQQEQPQQAQQQEPQEPTDPLLRAHIEQLHELKGSTRVQQQTLGREQHPGIVTWVAALVGGWVQNFVDGFIKEKVEKSFTAAEFLEGAKDAYFMVNQLINEQDWATLGTMTSSRLLDALRSTHQEYQRAGLMWTQETEGEVEAFMRGVSLWGKAQMAGYDKERVALAGGELTNPLTLPEGAWLVVSVSFHTRQRVRIRRMDDANLVGDITDLRPQRYKFARGPLPSGSYPVEELEGVPWFLLSV